MKQSYADLWRPDSLIFDRCKKCRKLKADCECEQPGAEGHIDQVCGLDSLTEDEQLEKLLAQPITNLAEIFRKGKKQGVITSSDKPNYR